MASRDPLPAVRAAEKELSGDARRALVARVVASPGFAKASHLRNLLLYLSEKAISEPGGEVSEQEIGSRVLGRRPDYDPQADNIVRVQIRHVRQKLDEYFAGDGRLEPVVITIPKGGHVLRFEPRAAPPVPPPSRGASRLLTAGRLGRAALALAVALAAFLLGRFSSSWTASPAAPHVEVSGSPLWDRLFSKDQETTVVIADSSLVFVQNTLRTFLTLGEYLNGSLQDRVQAVPEPAMRAALQEMLVRQYTSLADATVSGRLYALGTRMGARVRVRFSRHLNIRDFDSGNFILMGSKHSIPWVELFEPNLNFVMRQTGADWRFGFVNRQPLKAEAPAYFTVVRPGEPQETFATISELPNTARTGTVLLLDGITMEASEAAANFALSGDFDRLMEKVLGPASSRNLPYFEVLLRIQSMAGAPRRTEVLAWRKPRI